MPFSEQDDGPNQIGAFASVMPTGTDMNMGKMMGIGIINNILNNSAFLVILLFSFIIVQGYGPRVGLYALVWFCGSVCAGENHRYYDWLDAGRAGGVEV